MGEAVLTDGGAGGTESGPSSFSDVSWADASPASDPSTQNTTSPETVNPATSEVTPTPTEDRSPFIPRGRFDEVNTRLKAAEAWKQQYGWAEQIPQAELQQAIDLARQAASDPIAYMQAFIADLQGHPVHGAALRSLAAKALAAGRGQQPDAVPQPDVEITDAQGNVVERTFSASQWAKREAWLTQQLLAKVDEKYAPVVKTHEDVTRKAQEDSDRAAGQQFATNFTAELKDLYPTFDQHRAAIGQEVVRTLQQYPDDPRTNDPAFLESITLRAAQRIIGQQTRVQAETAVLDSLKQKAAANSSVHPGTAVASTPKRIDSFTQLGPDAWR